MDPGFVSECSHVVENPELDYDGFLATVGLGASKIAGAEKSVGNPLDEVTHVILARTEGHRGLRG